MPVSQRLQRLARHVECSRAPVILLPIILTSLMAAPYPMLRSAGIAQDNILWMMQLHSGNVFNLILKPIDPFPVGLSTLVLALTGLLMILRAARRLTAPLVS